jgi:hypothetical protein
MRKLLVVLLLLGVVAVGADRLAHKVATDEAEKRLAAEGLAQPSVSVGGFPFLTQLLSRRFDEVRVTSPSMSVSGEQAEQVSATGLDVRAPRGGDVVVGRLTARGTIPYEEVLRRADQPGLALSGAEGGDVRLTRDVTLQGRSFSVSALGRVEARSTRIRLVPTQLRLEGGESVGGSLETLLADQLAVGYDVTGLPDGVRIERVSAGADGFVVDVAGEDLDLGSVSLG